MADSPLDAILAPPVELPRLAAATVFNTYGLIGTALARVQEAYEKLPKCDPRAFSETADNLVQNCEAVIKHTKRLREANR